MNKKLIMRGGAMLLAGLLALSLFGCSSGERKAAPFQVVFTAARVNESAVSEFAASMLNEIPELTIDGNAPLFTPMVVAETQNNTEGAITADPMMAMAGIMRQAAMVSTNDIDVFISDMNNAARNARGDMFLPLGEIFTDAELAAMSGRLLSFDLVSADGYEATPTGAKTPICGIDITDNETMRRIFGGQEVGVFIVANTKNYELAKKVMTSLISN